MLWSDPENKPPKELRDAQAMMRRAGFLVALAMLVAMYVLGIR
ncbi:MULTISPECIES: morphogenic membrane protein MmpB [unclassified Streptomyces]